MRLLALVAMLTLPALALAQAPSQPPPPPASAPGDEVMYVCAGGQDFMARFSADGELVTLAVPGQPDVELSRQNSGTSFVYGDSYYELRGRGREVTLAVRGGGSLRCHAAGRPGQPARSFAAADGSLIVTLFPDGLFRLSEQKPSMPLRMDYGLWSEEVDGGLRIVARGGATGRRTFSETQGGLQPTEPPGPDLATLATPDLLDQRFELRGMFRSTNDGGVFTECVTGRLFRLLPSDAELKLEQAWTERTSARESALYATLIGRFAPEARLSVEEFVSISPDQSCPTPPAPAATLRTTEWRVIEIDGVTLVVDRGRRQPRIVLDEAGRYAGTTGCNNMGGTYTLDTTGLRFEPGPVTRMDCGEEARETEARFLAALAAVRQARLSGTTLDLSADGTRRLRLEARGR